MAMPYASRLGDHHDLVLPDGTRVVWMRYALLRREMDALGVVTPADAGKQALLDAYGERIDAEIKRILEHQGPYRRPSTPELMLLAARAVAAGARKQAHAA